jgi:FkbM family methyltransferase
MIHPEYDRKTKRLLSRRIEYQSGRLAGSMPFLRGRRTAIDVGAHVGLWTVQLLRVFSRVVSIEPHPDSFACLEANIVDLKSYLLQGALGAAPAMSRLQDWGFAAHLAEYGDGPLVNVFTLDGLAETNVDFLKIDVEGFETFVLQGGEETIRRDRPVIVLEQKHEQRYGLPDLAAVTLLQKWGAVVEWKMKRDYCLRWK